MKSTEVVVVVGVLPMLLLKTVIEHRVVLVLPFCSFWCF